MGFAGMDVLQPSPILDPAAHRIVPWRRAGLADVGAGSVLRCDSGVEPDARLLRQTLGVVCTAKLRGLRLSGRSIEPNPLRPAGRAAQPTGKQVRSEEHTSELQSRQYLR